MAIVLITAKLDEEINKTLREESVTVFSLMKALQAEPKKGKEIGCVGGILIKEIKYKKFRFYFISDGYKIKFLKAEELKDLVIKFVRMSDKNNQQKTIEEIKYVLRNLGKDGF